VLGIWAIAMRAQADTLVNIVVPAGALLVLLEPLTPIEVPTTFSAIVLTLVVVVLVLRSPVSPRGTTPSEQEVVTLEATDGTQHD
jgi:hypothetical protein